MYSLNVSVGSGLKLKNVSCTVLCPLWPQLCLGYCTDFIFFCRNTRLRKPMLSTVQGIKASWCCFCGQSVSCSWRCTDARNNLNSSFCLCSLNFSSSYLNSNINKSTAEAEQWQKELSLPFWVLTSTGKKARLENWIYALKPLKLQLLWSNYQLKAHTTRNSVEKRSCIGICLSE